MLDFKGNGRQVTMLTNACETRFSIDYYQTMTKAYSKNNLSPRNAIIPTIAISSGLPVGGIPGKRLSGCREYIIKFHMSTH
jgi:hypothetical protein